MVSVLMLFLSVRLNARILRFITFLESFIGLLVILHLLFVSLTPEKDLFEVVATNATFDLLF